MSSDFNDFYKILGYNIKQRRKSLGMTAMEFADLMKVGDSTVGNWEVGSCKIPLDKLVIVGAVLKIDYRHLLPIYNDLVILDFLENEVELKAYNFCRPKGWKNRFKLGE